MSDGRPTQYLPMSGSEAVMIRWMYTFNDWTRPQVIEAVGRLTDAQLRQPGAITGGLGSGSVFDTLVHLVDVEESWLARWMGTPEDPGPDPVTYATLESTAKQWEIIDQTRDAWLATLTGDQLAAPFRAYTETNGSVTTVPLWPALFHVLNHTAHHRAEIYEALTRFGLPPQIEPDVLDFGTWQAGVRKPFTSVYLTREVEGGA